MFSRCSFVPPWHLALAVVLASHFSSLAHAALPFPANPQQWLNSPPLSAEMLAGKGVFLWFFEEGCPRCEGRWPELLKMSASFEGQPVVFIGVNSGTPRAEIEGYLARNRISWPILLDLDRSFEKQAGVREISLENIGQVKVLKGDGGLQNGDWAEPASSAKDAANSGKWNVDPTRIPAALRPAWRLVEFGSYAEAAPKIRDGLKTSKAETKSAAEALRDYVTSKMEAGIEQANQAMSNDQKWVAFKSLQLVTQRFKGYEIPAEVATQLKDLTADPAIKNEQLAASKLRELLKKNAKSSRSAKKTLELVVKQFPNTEAATEAQALLESAGEK